MVRLAQNDLSYTSIGMLIVGPTNKHDEITAWNGECHHTVKGLKLINVLNMIDIFIDMSPI